MALAGVTGTIFAACSVIAVGTRNPAVSPIKNRSVRQFVADMAVFGMIGSASLGLLFWLF